MKQRFCGLFIVVVVAACHSTPVSNRISARDSAAIAAAAFKKAVLPLVDYKKDPACGMPLTAGLEDTTRYKGKLYGFCSKECKEEFLKNPVGFTATIGF